MKFTNPQFDDLEVEAVHIKSLVSFNHDYLVRESDSFLLKGNTLLVFLVEHPTLYKLELAPKFGSCGYMIIHFINGGTRGADIDCDEYNQLLSWVEDYLQLSINDITKGGLTFLDNADEREEKTVGTIEI